jgi:putative transposase
MGKAYSMDLRERVIMDIDGGLSVASVARKYRVSEWWIHQLKKRRTETGSIAAGRQGGHKPRAMPDAALLKTLVQSHPDATLTELQGLLKERKVEIKITTLWYNLEYAGLSVKKNRARRRTGA